MQTTMERRQRAPVVATTPDAPDPSAWLHREVDGCLSWDVRKVRLIDATVAPDAAAKVALYGSVWL